MATLDLVDVSKHVGSHSILDSINLSIKKGEFLVVVGPSGCGKSTLLRLIAGLDELSSGTIKINNQCVNNIPAGMRDMAMVFQNYALYPHMTVFDNMAYGLKLRRYSKKERTARVEQTANLLHLTPYLQRKPNALSGGQRQRVAMGRAIVRSPAVFLFDEPLSNLDAKLRDEMRHELRTLHKQLNTTSIYVTHDQTEAMTMAERVLILNQGMVEQLGTPKELYQTPATVFVAGFTGHYSINLFAAVFDKCTHQIKTEMGVSYPAPENFININDGTELQLAIRAEHVVYCTKTCKQPIELKVEFIDDMGADLLLQTLCKKTNRRFVVRLPACQEIHDEALMVEFPLAKIHIFEHKTGKRIGDWRGQNKE